MVAQEETLPKSPKTNHFFLEQGPDFHYKSVFMYAWHIWSPLQRETKRHIIFNVQSFLSVMYNTGLHNEMNISNSFMSRRHIPYLHCKQQQWDSDNTVGIFSSNVQHQVNTVRQLRLCLSTKHHRGKHTVLPESCPLQAQRKAQLTSAVLWRRQSL